MILGSCMVIGSWSWWLLLFGPLLLAPGSTHACTVLGSLVLGSCSLTLGPWLLAPHVSQFCMQMGVKTNHYIHLTRMHSDSWILKSAPLPSSARLVLDSCSLALGPWLQIYLLYIYMYIYIYSQTQYKHFCRPSIPCITSCMDSALFWTCGTLAQTPFACMQICICRGSRPCIYACSSVYHLGHAKTGKQETYKGSIWEASDHSGNFGQRSARASWHISWLVERGW